MSTGQLVLGGEHEERKVTRLRDVKLTQAEAADHGMEVGRLAGVVEDAKKQAKEAENKQDGLIAILKKGTKSEDVECTMKLFYQNRLVQVVDGEEVIEERAMTDDEFQRDLPLEHGVVMEPEGDMTPEEAEKDLRDTMRDEKNPNKPSLVDLKSS